VHYIGTIADKTDQLREAKKAMAGGRPLTLAQVASRMGVILATTEHELQLAYVASTIQSVHFITV
jgi:hypothetical protein